MMKIINFFDYIFYRIYHQYKFKWGENVPGSYAVSIVTLLQNSTGIILLFIYEIITKNYINFEKKYVIGVLLILFIFNILRYFKITSYDKLSEKWGNEEKTKHRKRGVLVLCYIIITLLTTLALAIIVGELNIRNMLIKN